MLRAATPRMLDVPEEAASDKVDEAEYWTDKGLTDPISFHTSDFPFEETICSVVGQSWHVIQAGPMTGIYTEGRTHKISRLCHLFLSVAHDGTSLPPPSLNPTTSTKSCANL